MPHFSFSLKSTLLTLGILMMPLFAYLIWNLSGSPQTLTTLADSYQQAGIGVKQDFQSLPTLPITQTDDTYQIEDTLSDGINIQYANETENNQQTTENKLNLSFPKDYSKPVSIKLDDQRVIQMTDLGGRDDYTVGTLTEENTSLGRETSKLDEAKPKLWQRILSFGGEASKKEAQNYLRYTSKDQRKSLLYAYQKDQATGEKKLKHWTLYQEGNGVEQEEYQFENAKVKVNEVGVAEVFYFGESDLKNEQVKAEVDSNLLERAQRTLAKDMGEDLMNGGQTPDFTIPKPYYIDRNGEKHEALWKWHEETSSLSVSFFPESYPVALDPTLQFTAPGMSNGGDAITGEAGSEFGFIMISGDFNSDSKTDLAVGAYGYSSYTGRTYIFYNDGFFATTAGAADVIITGEVDSEFGYALTSGDFNADGRTDIAISAPSYPSYDATGRVYIFHNDGSIPTTVAAADVTITGETIGDYFGSSLVPGDFNTDGKTDLAVGASGYSTGTGRVYIFHNDGSIPTTAATADVTITGDATGDFFGVSSSAGDFNTDGKIDLVVGAPGHSSGAGRAYVFHNDGSIPTTAGTADVTITGDAVTSFGSLFTVGDFNADGRTDLAVAATAYSTYTGRVYIFHNDGSIPTTAATADVTITGENSSFFGRSLASGDFNADGRTDLAVGASNYSSFSGRAYIFYNDGSIPTTPTTADVIITGELDSAFGYSMTTGDFNSDSKTDLAVGATNYSSASGRAYIFYSQNGQANTNQSITGEAISNAFGQSLVTGDFNADGRTDLAVGAKDYSTSTGRVYLFYGDGQIPSTAATADVTITGEATGNYFGYNSLAAGDFNADGETDLAVGAYGNSTNTGKAYIFYNDGSIPTTAATADVIITGETTSNLFGIRLLAGDFNADGETDLAVGASAYSGDSGRAYIFYNDGSIPTTAGTADVTISGEGASYFGAYMAAGDFNADSRIDLAIGAYGYSSYGNTGRVYIFYNDGSIPTTAGTADVTITGEATSNSFGTGFATGDFNADGRTDLAVGAYGYSTNTGRVYIFYGDGSIPTTAATADVIITGETTSNYFGFPLVAGDFNADGRTDLAVGAYGYSTNTGRAYIFYNDGSIPTTASTADVTITGETTNNYFGFALTGGDMNGDGRTDLIVGAHGNSSSTGKVYFYETRENFAWQIQKQPGTTPRTNTNGTGQELKITGEAGSGFGTVMTMGDMNSDGKPDLIVGAKDYSSGAGRVYVFYSDGSLTTGATSADIVITGDSASNYFGSALAIGDFNADGRVDLVVGAYSYGSGSGRVYLFYNDGSFPAAAASADVTIAGELASALGIALATGDLNADGKTDLAVGGYYYSGNYTGRVYIFYNDGSIPTAAGSADVIISGSTVNSSFGITLSAGDFNADGEIDLAVGQIGTTNGVYLFYNDGSFPATDATADVIITGPSSYFATALVSGDFNTDGRTDLAVGSSEAAGTAVGKVYIFHNDGTYSGSYAGADVTITGEATAAYFGSALGVGDVNADGRTDLVVGGYFQSTQTGRTYVFHNDGSIPTAAGSADVILTGESTNSKYGFSVVTGDFNADGRTDLAVGANGYSSSAGRVYVYTLGNDPVITGGATSNNFGYSLTSGDFNADGRIDLAVGASGYSTQTGRAYIFYNDGSIPATVATADVTITGEASSYFGCSLASGDFNADGKTDLAIGACLYSSLTGRTYIFYNDGSIPTTAGTADVIITGGATNDYFGNSLTSGDFNADGRTDLAVGAHIYSSGTGRAYIFYNDGSIPATAGTADVTITGETTANYFGRSLTSGDWNSDGRTDLAIGAYLYSSSTGRAYIFYNDGSIPTTAGTADVIITGEATSDQFGRTLVSGDFNADGRIDLAVGAQGYSTNTGQVYILYNDGSIPTTAGTADVAITGEASSFFGSSLTSGDWNSDGRTDLAIGAYFYSSLTGRAYLFYNDDVFQTTAGTADVTITGGATGDYFGASLTAGDWNSDGRTDLAVGAYGYSTQTGRVYVYASEVAGGDVSMEPVRVRGTLKTRGILKIR